jgi:hypothetical protein
MNTRRRTAWISVLLPPFPNGKTVAVQSWRIVKTDKPILTAMFNTSQIHAAQRTQRNGKERGKLQTLEPVTWAWRKSGVETDEGLCRDVEVAQSG